MPPTSVSVAALAMNFGGSITRIDPSDTRATLGRVAARNVNPSAVANAFGGTSIRHAAAGSGALLSPGIPSVSSERCTGTSQVTSRPITKTSPSEHQANFKKSREFFEALASKSKIAPPPARLDRSAIPKRLGTGNFAGAVVWEPKARASDPSVGGASSRVEAIDRPGKVASCPANIVQDRKIELWERLPSLLCTGEDVKIPTKFSMQCPVSPQPSLASSGNDSGRDSPLDAMWRDPSPLNGNACADMPVPQTPSARREALQSRFDVSSVERSKRMLSPASSEESLDSYHSDGECDLEMHASADDKNALERHFFGLLSTAPSNAEICVDNEQSPETAHSDYVSDFSGSSSPSSRPDSPTASDPVIPWSQVRAEALSAPAFLPPDEDVARVDVKDAIGQLQRAVDNQDKYRISDNVIELLDDMMEHLENGDVTGAYAVAMRALDGVTEIQTPSKSSQRLWPDDSGYAGEVDELDHWVSSTNSELTGQPTRAELLSEELDKFDQLPISVDRAWVKYRLEFNRAVARIDATIKRHAGTTWEGRANVLLAKVRAEARIDCQSAIDMARDGLKSIARSPRRLIDPEY